MNTATHHTQQTSLFAFAEVRRDLPARQRSVLEQLKEHEDMTDRELKMALGWEINAVVPRRNELVKAGMVEEAGRRLCKVTGRFAIAWRYKRV